MLIDKYRQIFDTPKLWKYYHKLDSENNPFDSESIAKEFISNYFKAGDKSSVIDPNIPADVARDIHSISAFFLGFLLKPLLKFPVLKPDFRYFWFMACLYHDYGYYVEKDRKNYLPNKFTLEKIIQNLDIKYNLLETNSNTLHITETIENYYNYCRKRDPSFLNHGIIGGLLLYNLLRKHFDENFEKAKIKNQNTNEKNFYYNGLHWSNDHDDNYKKVANSIVSHNIWYAYEPEVKEDYKEKKLDKLIIKDPSQRLKCQSDPFLFLLLLADTIEPIKFFTQYNFQCVLRSIAIDVLPKQKIISITVDNLCMDHHDWFVKIKDLENWLGLSVNNETENKLIIEIK